MHGACANFTNKIIVPVHRSTIIPLRSLLLPPIYLQPRVQPPARYLQPRIGAVLQCHLHHHHFARPSCDVTVDCSDGIFTEDQPAGLCVVEVCGVNIRISQSKRSISPELLFTQSSLPPPAHICMCTLSPTSSLIPFETLGKAHPPEHFRYPGT